MRGIPEYTRCIKPEDNEKGPELSLQKLAKYVEGE